MIALVAGMIALVVSMIALVATIRVIDKTKKSHGDTRKPLSSVSLCLCTSV